MSQRHVNAVIVGQGIAGTSLAWSLLLRGWSVLVVDNEQPATASRIAAGLITPVTGPRLAVTPDWARFWGAADRFYRRLEAKLDRRLLSHCGGVRILDSDEEATRLHRRLDEPEFRHTITSRAAQLDARVFSAPFGTFEMASAKLDVAGYLEASRREFASRGGFLGADLDVDEIDADSDRIALRDLSVTADQLILCQGFAGAHVARTRHIAFNPARGEILTVRVPELAETRSIHRRTWLAAAGEPGVFRTGATFDWDRLDAGPTPQGRDELLARLAEYLIPAVEVLEHTSAVRPAMKDHQPVLGRLPGSQRVWVFNGLGSRSICNRQPSPRRPGAWWTQGMRTSNSCSATTANSTD